MARPKTANPDTRRRILAAAAIEFGVHGFAATTVDRIARRARVNKAMIYYHFPHKRALYTCIIREVFAPIADRLRAATAQPGRPGELIARIIDALVRSVDDSSYFLPLFLREIADGGQHLGPDELNLLATIFATVSGVVVEGARQNVFQPVHPALAHFTIVGPLIMFRASAPVRARVKGVRHIDIPDADAETLTNHLQMVARRMLAPEKDWAEGTGHRAESKGQRAEGKRQRAGER